MLAKFLQELSLRISSRFPSKEHAVKNFSNFCIYTSLYEQEMINAQKNQTDCRADTTAKGVFIWANISTIITSHLQDHSYNEKN